MHLISKNSLYILSKYRAYELLTSHYVEEIIVYEKEESEMKHHSAFLFFDGQPLAVNRKPITDNRQPTTNNQQPTTNN